MKDTMQVKEKTTSVDLGPKLDAVPTVQWDEQAEITAINSGIAFGNAQRVATGHRLLLAKQQLPHGTFQAWCERNIVGASYMTLTRWMNHALADIEDKSNASLYLSSQQAKLEAMKSAAPGSIKEPAKMIERQEAKIEKLIAKTAPPVSFEKVEPATKQTDQEDRPPRPSPQHTWDPFSRAWYVPEPKKPSRPPCPGVEGTGNGEYEWSVKDNMWYKIHIASEWIKDQQAKSAPTHANAVADAQMKLAQAFTTILHTNTPEARKIMKQFFSTAFHPDSGKIKKDGQRMSDINQALTTLEK